MIPKALYRAVKYVGLSPSTLAMRNPFKIREYETLVRRGIFKGSDRVLDFGCGSGPQTLKLAQLCKEVVGIDISQEAIRQAAYLASCDPDRGNVRFICGDLFKTAFPTAHFDAVLSFCVLEHVPNLHEVLTELSRITKPGGKLHVSVDSLSTISDGGVIAKHRQDHRVFQYFVPDSIRTQLAQAGWQVSEVHALHKGPIASRHFSEFVQSWPARRKVKELISAPWLYRALREEDRTNPCEDRGIMLIARASNQACASQC